MRTQDVLVSAALMLRRLVRALRHAVVEEDFGQIAGAAIALLVTGTLVYTSATAGARSTASTSRSRR